MSRCIPARPYPRRAVIPASRGSLSTPPARGTRPSLSRLRRRTLAKVQKEDSHEQPASLHTAGRRYAIRYDPKTQWRAYREQQKAAWRAQRDAWKAQRYAWKASYGGGYVPRVPSVVGPIILVGIGIVGLLIYTGHISPANFWTWYGHWWPLLLIAAGLACSAEWAIDCAARLPCSAAAGFVGILILLGIFGLGASGWNDFWGRCARSGATTTDDNFFNFFGLPEHDYDQQVLNAQIPANAAIEIENPARRHQRDRRRWQHRRRCKPTRSHLPTPTATRKKSSTPSCASDRQRQRRAGQIREQQQRPAQSHHHRSPSRAQVTVNAGKGDVTAAGLGAGITVTAAHGDVHLSTITRPGAGALLQ